MIARGLNVLLSGWSGRGLLAALLAVAVAIPWLVGDQSYVTYLVFTFFVFAVFGHAWNLLAGYCGLLSFGNQVYVGIGGFTLAIIFYYGGINVWLALPISGIVTAAFAFLLATPVRESLVGIGVWKPVAVAGVLWARLRGRARLLPRGRHLRRGLYPPRHHPPADLPRRPSPAAPAGRLFRGRKLADRGRGGLDLQRVEGGRRRRRHADQDRRHADRDVLRRPRLAGVRDRGDRAPCSRAATGSR